jgi:hypothetical protein
VLTNQRRLPFTHQASFRAKERLKLIHGDLCGPRPHREDDVTSCCSSMTTPATCG